MINVRGAITLLFIAMVSLAACESRAQDASPPRHQRPGKITCAMVRDFVAMVGAEQAEKLARDAGASEDRLAAARKCIHESTQQTETRK